MIKHVQGKKERDKAVIEAVVRSFGPLSRAEIRQLTHLRWTAISHLVREIISEGKLLEVGRSSNPRGRKQILLRLNEDHAFIVGVIFDPETVSATVMNLFPRIKSMVTEATLLEGGKAGLVRQLFACADNAIRQAGIPREKVVGIGVADPGLVNMREGTSIGSANIAFWEEVPLRELFEKEFGVPTVLDSDSRAEAVAERILGAGKMTEDLIYIQYGKGIGAGIISEGKALYGHNGIAGEFGHIPMIENGPPCNCGSFGCLEAIIGLSAIETRCRKAIQEGGNSQALQLANGDAGKITGWTVLQAAKLGDKTCVAIVEELGKYLGLGIATLVNLFNPSLVVLDHRLASAGPSLLEQITRVVRKQALARSTVNLEFRYGTLGSEAGPLGVGLSVLERMFEIPVLKPPTFMIEKSALEVLSSNRRAWAESPNAK